MFAGARFAERSTGVDILLKGKAKQKMSLASVVFGTQYYLASSYVELSFVLRVFRKMRAINDTSLPHYWILSCMYHHNYFVDIMKLT